MAGSYKDLRVCKQSMELAELVYQATAEFPRHELYGLANQSRRAAVSVPSNIAEGKGHRSDREFLHFLFHARGSLLELETQLNLATRLGYISSEQTTLLIGNLEQVARGLNALINALSGQARESTKTNG